MPAHLVHIARIPVLVALLAATEPFRDAITAATVRIDPEAVWEPWAKVTAIGLAFVAVCLFDRSRPHLRIVLVAEAVIAAILALPTVHLVGWTHRFEWLDGLVGWGTFDDFTRALAITWLVTAVMTFVRQRRREEVPQPVSGT